MALYDSELYMKDVLKVANMNLPWEKLRDKSVAISGATGMIGSFLVDVLFSKNETNGLGCRVIVLGRDEEKARRRFLRHEKKKEFSFASFIAEDKLSGKELPSMNYVMHLASNTHPKQYAVDPIGTITTNVIGTKNLLDIAVLKDCERFLFASSNEVYGENRGDVEEFDEDYCGYINSNTLRAGYPESKRCGEALCQAYKKQYGLDVVIARLTRTYGPTMNMSDTKVISQFIKNGMRGEDIVLKSAGTQQYSFQYVADSVSGILTVLLSGISGEAYNISDNTGNISLKDLANVIAQLCEKKVVFDLPDKVEAEGFSVVTKALLCGDKIRGLGWLPLYRINEGVERTIAILKEVYGRNEGCIR